MQTHTENTSAGRPTPSKLLIDAVERHGLTYRLWMYSPTSFGYDVFENTQENVIHAEAGTYAHAGRAGLAAEGWIDATIYSRGRAERLNPSGEVTLKESPAEPAEPEPEGWTPMLAEPSIVAGWRLEVLEEKGRGTYGVDVRNEAGEAGGQDFSGFMGLDEALGQAHAWALAHPCDGSTPSGEGEGRSPVEEMAAELAPATAGLAEVEAADPAPAPAPDPAPAKPSASAVGDAALRRQIADLQRQLAVQSSDLTEAAEKAAEQTRIALELSEVDQQIKLLKDRKKGLEASMAICNGEMGRAVRSVAHGAPAQYQRTLTFANDEATREAVGSAAERVVEQLGPEQVAGPGPTGPEGWAYNGKEYTIDVEPVATGGCSAWLRGHRATTEAPHETRDGAIEAAKMRAATALEDAEPGEAVPADAPRKTRQKKPKADDDGQARLAQELLDRVIAPKDAPRLKGRNRDGVAAALSQCRDLAGALEVLECTKGQLEKFCKKVGIDVGRTIGTADLPEAPPEKAQARGRGKAHQ